MDKSIAFTDWIKATLVKDDFDAARQNGAERAVLDFGPEAPERGVQVENAVLPQCADGRPHSEDLGEAGGVAAGTPGVDARGQHDAVRAGGNLAVGGDGVGLLGGAAVLADGAAAWA
ncbi:hypothetical protein [Streptomyces exfoliatus]|uniref:hypothetical protein n=1 Tax=Streptomyces exfoliatus TaxID=1905 RepID=UPI003C2CDBB5